MSAGTSFEIGDDLIAGDFDVNGDFFVPFSNSTGYSLDLIGTGNSVIGNLVQVQFNGSVSLLPDLTPSYEILLSFNGEPAEAAIGGVLGDIIASLGGSGFVRGNGTEIERGLTITAPNFDLADLVLLKDIALEFGKEAVPPQLSALIEIATDGGFAKSSNDISVMVLKVAIGDPKFLLILIHRSL